MAKSSGITFEQIIAELQRKVYRPIYFLCGETDYYIDQISNYIEQHILSEDEKDLNQTVFFGKDSAIDQIISAARRYPVMSPYQVIIVKEAQELRDIDNLIYYLQKPLTSTILTFCYKHGKLDKRKKVASHIGNVGLLYETPPIYDNQVAGWITSYTKSIGLVVDSKAANMLADFLGTDLSRIVNEINKLKIILPNDNNRITPELVERNIGISKNYNAFEFCRAIGTRNILLANRIVEYVGNNDKQLTIHQLLPVLFSYFVTTLHLRYLQKPAKEHPSGHTLESAAAILKIHPYLLRDNQTAIQHYSEDKLIEIIHLIRIADAKSKGFETTSTTNGYQLLKELTFRILH
ncbi:MAG: DNA polymerase III subunit delta [Prevotellaceae bacterium]|jgi:DNA polymerase-3 subunit delta|nr:DNA polymerase III subunit delta [Prevotellaceae bacterium]